jgi:hypothetical protein
MSGFTGWCILIVSCFRLPLTLTPAGFARGSAPARRKGSLTLARAGLPNLPRLRLVQIG